MMPKRSRSDDFQVLSRASDLIIEQLLFDENIPDLFEQFSLMSGHDGNQQYFLDPYLSSDPLLSAWTPMFEHKSCIPFPPQIFGERRRVECMSFMGIFVEINRAWVTVDNRLYLWDYNNPESYLVYDSLDDVIVSVANCLPKPGIFTEQVKHLIVVATSSSVHILALVWENQLVDMRIQNTKYTISSDNVTILKVIGSSTGRIFMAGDDSNLYELVYENNQESWTSYLGIEAPFKCRKIRHGGFQLISLLVPSFVWGLVGSEESLVDLVADDALQLLYTVSSSGNLGMFYFGRSGGETHQILPSFSSIFNFNIISEARDFLVATSPRGSPDLALLDSSTTPRIRVVSAHAVPRTESASVHLVVVISTGLRIYFTVKASDGRPFVASTQAAHPSHISVVHIRAPPPTIALEKAKAGERSLPGEAFAPSSGGLQQGMGVGSSYYSHGVFLAGCRRTDETDMVVGVGEDLVSRRADVDPMLLVPQPSLRESLCVPRPQSGAMEGRIYEIREAVVSAQDPTLARLKQLFQYSKTPRDQTAAPFYAVDRSTSGFGSFQDSTAVASGLSAVEWLRPQSLAVLSELCLQGGPAFAFPQRRFLAVFGGGIHVLSKIRPVDILHRILSVHGTGDEFVLHAQTVLNRFGALHFCAMCLSLACGLPADVSTAPGPLAGVDGLSSLSNVTISAPVADIVRRRAVIVMLRTCGQPSFRSGYPSQGYPALTNGYSTYAPEVDSRAVFSSKFCFSVAHNGLALFLSRLLRPVWLKPVVQPVSRLAQKPSFLSTKPSSSLSPALTCLLSRSQLALLKTPLLRLHAVLRDFYSSAVSRELKPSANGAPTSDESAGLGTSGDVGGRSGSLMDGSSRGSFTARQLASMQQPKRDPQAEARLIEETSVNAIYRLAARTVQIFSLFEILLAAETDSRVPVPWERLSGYTFEKLVTSDEAHDAIRALLLHILNLPKTAVSSATMDVLMTQLSSHCFLLFSVGDKFAYEAGNLLESMRSSLNTATHRDAQASRAASMLTRAAAFWTSLSSVSGDDSDLFVACRKLCLSGPAGCDGAVDLCLVTVANFTEQVAGRISGLLMDDTNAGAGGVGGLAENTPYSWERNLYHGGGARSAEERAQAKKAVYECLLHQLRMLRSLRTLGGGPVSPEAVDSDQARAMCQRMVRRALERSGDLDLHRAVYEDLLDADNDMLLSVRSPFLEDFLREVRPALLYNYFERHQLHAQASLFADEVARADSVHPSLSLDAQGLLSLAQRVQFLMKALHSVKQLRGRASGPATDSNGSAVSNALLGFHPAEKQEELQAAIDLAEIQIQVHGTLSQELSAARASLSIGERDRSHSQASPPARSRAPSLSAEASTGALVAVSDATLRSINLLQNVVDTLASNLVDISFLYNKAAYPYKLWDACLCILSLAEEEEPSIIAQLWKSLLYRVVPVSASSQSVQESLQDRRRSAGILEDKRRQQRSVGFEDSRWPAEVANLIKSLGDRLCLQRERNPFAMFPLTVLLEELEELAGLITGAGTTSMRGWPVRCLKQVQGVSFGMIVDGFFELNKHWMGRRPDRILQLLWDASYCMEVWVTGQSSKFGLSISSGEAPLPSGSVDLSDADSKAAFFAFQSDLRSGSIRVWTDSFKNSLSGLPGHSLSVPARTMLSDVGRSLDVVDRIVRALSLA